MASKREIQHAVKSLDPDEDAHWTKGGDPSVLAVIEILGEKLTRQDVSDATDETRPITGEGTVTVEPEDNPHKEIRQHKRLIFTCQKRYIERVDAALTEAIRGVEATVAGCKIEVY